MTRYRGRSPSPRRRRRSPSPRRRRSRSQSRSRGRRRSRSRTRSHSPGHRSQRRSRSRTRSPRRRSPPRVAQGLGSPRRRSPPRRSPPRRSPPRRSPPRRPIPSPPRSADRYPPPEQSQTQRDIPRERERELPPHVSPPTFRQRSRSPIRNDPRRHISPPRERIQTQQSWEQERHTEREKEWAPRRETPPPNFMEDVMRGLHQPKKEPSPPLPTAHSPPRRDSRQSFRGRSPSPQSQGFLRQHESYRDRRVPVHSRLDDRSVETRHQVVSSSTTKPQKQKIMLKDRFKTADSDRPLKIDENITVDIRRKIQGTPVSFINRAYNPNEVVIIRRKDEGLKRIFDREELRGVKYPEDEEVETRVIKVVKKQETSHYRDDDRFRSGPEHSGGYRGPADEGMRIEVRMGKARSPEPRRDDRRRSPDHRSDRRVAVRDRSGDRRPVDRRISFDRNRAENPSDLRNSLNRRREEGSRDSRRVLTDSRDSRRPAPGGQKVSVTGLRDRLGSRGRGRGRSAPEAAPAAPLPDFSRRPDKFRYEEWMDKPEMVPKGISYFEHDNREGEGSSDSFRGRGRGRGRGGFRGRWMRGGGGTHSSRDRRDDRRDDRHDEGSGGKWKHDRFRDDQERKEAQPQEDNKPTSTTESK